MRSNNSVGSVGTSGHIRARAFQQFPGGEQQTGVGKSTSANWGFSRFFRAFGETRAQPDEAPPALRAQWRPFLYGLLREAADSSHSPAVRWASPRLLSPNLRKNHFHFGVD